MYILSFKFSTSECKVGAFALIISASLSHNRENYLYEWGGRKLNPLCTFLW